MIICLKRFEWNPQPQSFRADTDSWIKSSISIYNNNPKITIYFYQNQSKLFEWNYHKTISFLHDFRFGGRMLHMLWLLGPLWSLYKGFFKIPLFSSSSVFLMVLNIPSGVENSNVKNPPLSYIKSCVLACTLKIWTSFVALPKQNLA